MALRFSKITMLLKEDAKSVVCRGATNKAKLRKDNRLHAEPERIGLRSDREGDQDIALKKL
jgi:hypothetical protein